MSVSIDYVIIPSQTIVKKAIMCILKNMVKLFPQLTSMTFPRTDFLDFGRITRNILKYNVTKYIQKIKVDSNTKENGFFTPHDFCGEGGASGCVLITVFPEVGMSLKF